jgi:hypothetical protein
MKQEEQAWPSMSSNVVDEGATMASTCLTGQRPRCIFEAGLFEGLDVI